MVHLKKSGFSLVELMLYTTMFGIVILASLQAIQYAKVTNARITNTASAAKTAISGLELLRHYVSEAETNIEIETVGSTLNSNCIEMSKTEAGVTSTFSILIDNSLNDSGSHSLYRLETACPATIPANLGSPFSSDVFAFNSAVTPFDGIGTADDSGAFAQVEFTFSSTIGKGDAAGGIDDQSIVLTVADRQEVACKISTPNTSWFTDFGTNELTSATVSITLNFAATDRLAYVGDDSDVVQTNLNDIGVLHLHSTSGKTVSEWIEVFGEVTYTTTATSVSQSDPPKRFAFALGAGLPYTVGGIPSVHFYFAKELSSNSNYNTARDNASDTCYPEFVTDTNFLGIDQSMDCSPRLTGHLPTLSQEGEDAFIRNRVLKMVYPATEPTDGTMFGTVTKNPTSGSFWLGGRFNMGSDSSCNDDKFRWEDGFEVVKGNGAEFANRCGSSGYARLQGDSAGYYWNSIEEISDITSKNGQKLVYSVANLGWGTAEKYWTIRNGTAAERNLLAIEFGDNRNNDTNGSGTVDDADERDINSALKLMHEVSVVPSDFFAQCD